MSLKFTPYSFSKISTYKTCPRKFKYQYIDKIGTFLDTPALIKGRTIHYLIENSSLLPEQYTDEMKQNIIDFPETLEIKRRFEESELGIKYLRNIDKNAVIEYKLGLTKMLDACSYNRDSLFNGIVDYICVKDSVLYLVDWKSGRYKDARYQDYNQLLFYSIYFFQKYNITKIIISFVYVEHNIENDLELDITYLDSYKRELLLPIKTIEEDNSFEMNKTRLCDWCGFKPLCFTAQ